MKSRLLLAAIALCLSSCIHTMTYQSANGEIFTASAWGGRGNMTATNGAGLAYDNTESFKDGAKAVGRMATWGVFGGGLPEVTKNLYGFLRDRDAIEAGTTETISNNETAVAIREIEAGETLGLAELEAP